MHSKLVLIYAGYGDLAAATSVAAPSPFSPLPSPFRLLRYVFDLRLATSCGLIFIVSACVCVVDISSCPSGWTDVTSSSFTSMGQKEPPESLPISPLFKLSDCQPRRAAS